MAVLSTWPKTFSKLYSPANLTVQLWELSLGSMSAIIFVSDRDIQRYLEEQTA